jgi:hypothetical protein
MGVVSVKELPTGRSGEREAVSGRETRRFRVVTDTPYDSCSSIIDANVLPRYLDPHPANAYLRCKRLRCEPEVGRTVWIADAEYNNDPLTQEERELQTAVPYERKPQVVLTSERAIEPIDRDYRGSPIVNTATKPFDPPTERERSIRSYVISKNLPAVPTWIDEYEDAVNQSSITIRGRTYGPRCAKIGPITIPDFQEQNGFIFIPFQLTIDIRKPPRFRSGTVFDGVTRQAVTYVGGWDSVLLNQGLQERVTERDGETLVDPAKWRNILVDGEPANAAQPLKLNGVANPDVDPSDLIYLRWDAYQPMDFGPLASLWS